MIGGGFRLLQMSTGFREGKEGNLPGMTALGFLVFVFLGGGDPEPMKAPFSVMKSMKAKILDGRSLPKEVR